MILHPILDKIIIEPDRDIGEKKLDSGIIIPGTRKETGAKTGIVRAVGPDVKHASIKQGRKAYFDSRMCGDEVRIAGKKTFFIMREEFILGIEEE